MINSYHNNPDVIKKNADKFKIDDAKPENILPKMGLSLFLLNLSSDARQDLPKFTSLDNNSLLTAIRSRITKDVPQRNFDRADRIFDLVTALIFIIHILPVMVLGMSPIWVCILMWVVTRTSLAGAGHYYIHRKKHYTKKGHFHFVRNMAHSLFDMNYVGRICCLCLVWLALGLDNSVCDYTMV